MSPEELNTLADDRDLMEVGRAAIEEAAIGFRDARISELMRGNGIVAREADGSPSHIIRFGPETAVSIALRAIATHLSKGAERA